MGIHRDFKPGNVLLQCEQATGAVCKLADFGASCSLQKNMANEVVGTPLYMAPEACQGDATAASDVWGVGVTVCEMLCGRVPYVIDPDSFNPAAFIFQLRKGGIRPVLPDALKAE